MNFNVSRNRDTNQVVLEVLPSRTTDNGEENNQIVDVNQVALSSLVSKIPPDHLPKNRPRTIRLRAKKREREPQETTLRQLRDENLIFQESIRALDLTIARIRRDME